MTDTDSKTTDDVVQVAKTRSEDAGKAVASFVREHPLLFVAGGVALGAVAAAFLPRGTSRAIARRAVSLAEVASAAGALLGSRARETAEATGAGLREHGAAAAERLEKLGETASERFGKLSEAASAGVERLRDPVESAASKVVKKAAELRSRVGH